MASHIHGAKSPCIPYLPQVRFIDGLGSVLLEHFKPNEMEEIYNLLCAAAVRGEDVGADEYPTFEDWLDAFDFAKKFHAGGIVTIRENKTYMLKAIIYWRNSRYSRSLTPCLAEMKLVMAEGVRDTSAFHDLLNLGAEMIKNCGVGFVGMIIETFLSDHNGIKVYRDNRFNIAMIVPALIKHPKLGMTECAVYHKDFGTPLPSVSTSPDCFHK